MYFFDANDFAFPRGSATSNLQIFHTDTWYSHYYMKDFVFVNNPDATLGVYYDPNYFTGTTDTIQNFTSQITEEYCSILSKKFDETRTDLIKAFYDGENQLPECYRDSVDYTCASERFATFFQTFTYKNIPNCYWDKRRQKCVTTNDPLDLACCGDDFTVNFNELMTEPLSAATTNEQFDTLLTTELIDSKNRKTISSYPTLRALYDRYKNSSLYTGVKSSAYDYTKMDNIANMVGTYWVDVIEQVIPATTIWGSVKIYSNTVFDQQKYMYKKGSLFTCVSDKTCNINVDNLNWLNDCMGNIINTFYNEDCPLDDYEIPPYTALRQLDFMDDLSIMPSFNDLVTYGMTGETCSYSSIFTLIVESVPGGFDGEDTAGYYREKHNLLLEQQDEVITKMKLGFRKGQLPKIDYSVYKYNYPFLRNENTGDINVRWWEKKEYYDNLITPKQPFYKGPLLELNYTWWCKASTYPEWTGSTYVTHGLTLNDILTGVDDFTYLPAVYNIVKLPSTANAGELICVGTPSSYVGYAWDPILSDWSSDFYDFINTEILTQRVAQRDNVIDKKRDAMLSIKPFLWANEYVMSHGAKQWLLSSGANTPLQRNTDIVASKGAVLPPKYEMTASTHTLSGFCATSIIV